MYPSSPGTPAVLEAFAAMKNWWRNRTVFVPCARLLTILGYVAKENLRIHLSSVRKKGKQFLLGKTISRTNMELQRKYGRGSGVTQDFLDEKRLREI
jgi:hypothetical protein